MKKTDNNSNMHKRITIVFIFILLLQFPVIFAQRTVTGKITDNSGEGLPGATILLKDSMKGTTSDLDGNYSIDINGKGDVLQYNFVGYTQQEIEFNGQAEIDVVLEPATTAIEEVVATGYHSLPKTRATGASATLNSKEMNAVLSTDLMEKMAGQLAGVDIRDGNIIIRGQNTFNVGEANVSEASGIKLADGSVISYRRNPSAPLVVLDGFPYEGNINDLDPNDIESVTILKDAASASIWGTRASNGVIVLTRKKAEKDKTKIRFDSFFSLGQAPDFSEYNYAPAYLALDIERYALNSFGGASNIAERLTGTTALEEIYYRRDVLKDISTPEAEQLIEELRHKSNYQQGQEAFLRNSFTQNYNFQISHQSSKFTSILALNLSDNKLSEIGNSYTKYNVSLRTKYNLTRWATLNLNYTTNITDRSKNSMASYFTGGSIRPYEMLYDENGDYLPMYYSRGKALRERIHYEPLGYLPWHWNALEEQNNNDKRTNSRVDILQMKFNLKLLKWANFSSQIQYQTGSNETNQYYNRESFLTRDLINTYTQIVNVPGTNIDVFEYNFPTGGGTRQISTSSMHNINFRNQLNVNKSFAGVHNLQFHTGMDLIIDDIFFDTQTIYGYNSASGEHGNKYINLRDLTVDYLENSSQYTYNGDLAYLRSYANSTGFTKNRDFALFGNLGYMFHDRYNLSLSGRLDKSNLTGPDKSNFLWSVGAGWIVSNEEFFKSVNNIFSYAKIRGSYGYTGNVDRSALPYLRGIPKKDPATGTSYIVINDPSNPTLKPERTRNINVGLDVSLLKQRLFVSTDFYHNLSKNLIVDQATDPTSKGWTSGKVNNGSIENTGMDLKIDARIIEKKDFSYKATLNLAFNQNITKDYTTDNSVVFIKELFRGNTKISGYDINPIFAFDYVGVNDKGSPMIKIGDEVISPELYDNSGNPIEGYDLISLDNLTYMGGATPKYFGGLFNTINYKQFSLMFSFNYSLGHYMRMPVIDLYANNARQKIPYDDVRNAWKIPGDENYTNIPKLVGSSASVDNTYDEVKFFSNHVDWYKYASTNVEKADNIRLKYINLGYSLPKSFVQKFRIQYLKVSFQIDNIWYWAANSKGVDPLYVNRPNPMVYTLGINTSF